MHFDDGPVHCVQCIQQSDRAMRIGTRIDDDTAALLTSLLDPIDQHAFMIGLAENDLEPMLPSARSDAFFDVGQRGAAINLRLSRAEEIEIRPIKDIYGEDHGRRAPGMRYCRMNGRRSGSWLYGPAVKTETGENAINGRAVES